MSAKSFYQFYGCKPEDRLDVEEALRLETEITRLGGQWVCINCKEEVCTFNVPTGHDHTDYTICFCKCRDQNESI